MTFCSKDWTYNDSFLYVSVCVNKCEASSCLYSYQVASHLLLWNVMFMFVSYQVDSHLLHTNALCFWLIVIVLYFLSYLLVYSVQDIPLLGYAFLWVYHLISSTMLCAWVQPRIDSLWNFVSVKLYELSIRLPWPLFIVSFMQQSSGMSVFFNCLYELAPMK